MTAYTAIVHTNFHTVSVCRFYAQSRKKAIKKVFSALSTKAVNIRSIDIKSDLDPITLHQRFKAFFVFAQKVAI